ncbi:MAG TPA: hypothetical protein VGW77_05020 [Candidatus Binatia bacterium]|nr:hypothetical protein [Candidatus Binatia bacterium]
MGKRQICYFIDEFTIDKPKDAIMEREITLDNLRTMAQLAGLKLADEELQRLLAGVTRSKKQVAELRAFIATESEPAATFNAAAGK